MEITLHTTLDALQQEAALRLWNNEYPESLRLESAGDFDQYLENLSEKTHYLVSEQGKILGWAMTFQREDTTWFAMILESSVHGKGIGSAILEQMKRQHNTLFGWVIDHEKTLKANGDTYPSPLMFYLKNGFEAEEAIRLELPTISAVRIVSRR